MPIWLRNYTFNIRKEHFDKQREEHEKQQNIITPNTNNIKRPDIVPDYIVKAPKK